MAQVLTRRIRPLGRPPLLGSDKALALPRGDACSFARLGGRPATAPGPAKTWDSSRSQLLCQVGQRRSGSSLRSQPPLQALALPRAASQPLRVEPLVRCSRHQALQLRQNSTPAHMVQTPEYTATPPGGGYGGNGSSSSSSSGSGNGMGGRVRRVLILCVKGVAIWLPAVLFWVSLVHGGPLLDFRTDEEIQEEEHEMLRLERFFDVEGLSEAEVTAEWTGKEAALSQILEKLLRSQRVLTMLTASPGEAAALDDGGSASSEAVGAVKVPTLEVLTSLIEVSYVLPPPASEDGSTSTPLEFLGRHAQAAASAASAGLPPPWAPRLILAHRGGSLILVSLLFEHVVRGKDREERWACTEMRGDLMAAAGGEPTCVPICNLSGPVPHGVRYMRI